MTKHKKEEAAHHPEGVAPEAASTGTSETTGEMDALRDKLAEKEKEAAANYDKYVRALAELENYKRFAAREKADLLKFGSENIVKDIIPCLDNLDRALDHVDKTQDVEKLVDGLRMIQDQILCCLGKHGVQKIECVGQEFDPNLHEAIHSVETDEHEENKVLNEYQKGYLLNNRLLKAAKVSVSKRKKE